MYKVNLTAGGPLSGSQLREEYRPGQTYTYPDSDSEYVEGVLRGEGRLRVEHFPDAPAAPESEPAGPVSPEPESDDKPEIQDQGDWADKVADNAVKLFDTLTSLRDEAQAQKASESDDPSKPAGNKQAGSKKGGK